MKSLVEELSILHTQSLHDPHRVLGLHGDKIRIWRPGANTMDLEVKGRVVSAEQVDERGLFEYSLREPIQPQDYRIYHPSGLLAHDPYSFLPTMGEIDTFLFNKGCHYQLYGMLGANLKKINGISGTQFGVWAPNARSVSLVGEFNHWDGQINPMRSMGVSGVWELFVPGIGEGEKYKFEIHTKEGYSRVKSDPFAFYSELRPMTASVIYDVDRYAFNDQEWMEARAKQGWAQPINVYEVHLGSWKNFGTEFPNYRQVAPELAKYCKEMGFTHIELMPIMEHPLDESWGYQVTGFFSTTSRYGTPSDFQFFVDHFHQNGIGVILDWVPAHFPTDDYSLNRFDGTALYEHEDPRRGIHPHWQTAIFNYSRHEVSNFLIASALFWLDKMHIDGLRVDAVASLIYLDYGRRAGEWLPNPDGSNFNIEAIDFLKHLTSIVHQRFPSALMIAEESSSFQGVTHPVDQGGLGFDLKWNMGWMNDTLSYFHKDPIYRKFHQNDLTFSLLYVFSEKFMCVLSHDEMVHGKGSLVTKMPGPDWQKFASVRLLYSYMMCHPGKKLIFMGGEVGQWNEWDCKAEVDWLLLQYLPHRGLQQMVRELNHFYLSHPALWEYDFDWRGYEWIDFSDSEHSVIAYMRKGGGACLAIIHNFTPEYHADYPIPLKAKRLKEVFNSDAEQYGGSGRVHSELICQEKGFLLHLAPLATLIFEVYFEA